ncbi:hypothetical protein ACFQY8_07685 [Alloscardovia venturai]|uniref:Uncharacterized protein n=1 Tax=Alloscardovia venturai TaxID=1769421 RepID=A0ABW2YAK5_9BIFI
MLTVNEYLIDAQTKLDSFTREDWKTFIELVASCHAYDFPSLITLYTRVKAPVFLAVNEAQLNLLTARQRAVDYTLIPVLTPQLVSTRHTMREFDALTPLIEVTTSNELVAALSVDSVNGISERFSLERRSGMLHARIHLPDNARIRLYGSQDLKMVRFEPTSFQRIADGKDWSLTMIDRNGAILGSIDIISDYPRLIDNYGKARVQNIADTVIQPTVAAHGAVISRIAAFRDPYPINDQHSVDSEDRVAVQLDKYFHQLSHPGDKPSEGKEKILDRMLSRLTPLRSFISSSDEETVRIGAGRVVISEHNSRDLTAVHIRLCLSTYYPNLDAQTAERVACLAYAIALSMLHLDTAAIVEHVAANPPVSLEEGDIARRIAITALRLFHPTLTRHGHGFSVGVPWDWHNMGSHPAMIMGLIYTSQFFLKDGVSVAKNENSLYEQEADE